MFAMASSLFGSMTQGWEKEGAIALPNSLLNKSSFGKGSLHSSV
jgi:hypothetical protein